MPSLTQIIDKVMEYPATYSAGYKLLGLGPDEEKEPLAPRMGSAEYRAANPSTASTTSSNFGTPLHPQQPQQQQNPMLTQQQQYAKMLRSKPYG